MEESKIEVKGKDLIDALRTAATVLKTTIDRLDYNIIEGAEKSGFFKSKTKETVISVARISDDLMQKHEQRRIERRKPKGFYIKVKSDGVFVKFESVYRASWEYACDLISKRGIQEYDEGLLKIAFHQLNGKWSRIADYIGTVENESQLDLQISNHKLTATLMMTKPFKGAKTPDYDEVIDFLKINGVIYGIDLELIYRMVEYEICNSIKLIAQGQEPVIKRGEAYKYHFLNQDSEKKEEKQQERHFSHKVNHRESLQSLNTVAKGLLLAEKIPAQDSVPGMNIEGVEFELPEDTTEYKLIAGENIRVSDDGKYFYADADGIVYLKKGELSISDTYIIPGNLDFSVGNVNFQGDVEVKGDILPGFKITSGKGITVHGVANGVELEAAGHIVLKQGLHSSKVKTAKSIFAQFLDHSMIEAKGNITVKNEIVNCDIICGDKVILFSGKGVLSGGHVKTKNLLLAKRIIGNKTKVEVDLEEEVLEMQELLEAKMKNLDDQIKKALFKMKDVLQDKKKDKQERLAEGTRYKEYINAAKSKRNKIIHHLDTMVKYREKIREKASVIVQGSILEGFILSMFGSTLAIRENLSGKMFHHNNKRIAIQPYNALEVQELLSSSENV